MTEQGEFLGKSQYLIGDILFGDNTNIPVSKVEIQPWNVNNQDFQIIRSDELRFGIDNLVPAPIVFTMAVMNNWALENMPASAGMVPQGILYQARTLLGQLSNIWKATTTRQTWGAMVMLLFVDTDGVKRRIYGRPGKFQHGPVEQNEWVDVQAEFRRADTNAYEDVETFTEIGYNTDPVTITRDRGDAPAWFRVLLYGPLNHPIVTIGNCQIELDIDIAPETIVEVSSYPWMRRIVDSNGINWRAALIGSSQYLDQLQIPPNAETVCRWTDTSLTTWTVLPSSDVVAYNNDFLSTFELGGHWHVYAGKPMWGFSLAHGGYLYAPFGLTSILDIEHSFTSPSQFAQASIGDIWNGLSTIVILCADDFSHFAGVQILKTVGLGNIVGEPTANDKLRIVTSINYIAMVTQFEYSVPSPGIQPEDTVAIAYDDSLRTCYILYNGVEVGSWVDSASVINSANVRQGFIMNQDDEVTHPIFGVSFNNVIAYDATFTAVGPPPSPGDDLSSRVFLYWRETWNVE